MQLSQRQRTNLWGWAVGLAIFTVVVIGGVFAFRADNASTDRRTKSCERAGGVYVDLGDGADEVCMNPDFIVPTEAP